MAFSGPGRVVGSGNEVTQQVQLGPRKRARQEEAAEIDKYIEDNTTASSNDSDEYGKTRKAKRVRLGELDKAPQGDIDAVKNIARGSLRSGVKRGFFKYREGLVLENTKYVERAPTRVRTTRKAQHLFKVDGKAVDRSKAGESW